MAGSKQHHVWQMLQRGFGTKRGRDHHVWVYQRNQPAKRTATRLFGVEKHFYGPEGSDADTNITRYENDNQSVIQDIRSLPDGAVVDPNFAAALIAHLEMRSSFLRQEATTKLQGAVDGLVEDLKSPKALRELMIKYLKQNPEHLDEFMAKGFVHPSDRGRLSKLALHAVEHLSDADILATMEPGVREVEGISGLLRGAIEEGQNKALRESAVNDHRKSMHVDYNFQVFRPNGGGFILPDTTLCFIKRKGAAPFSQKGDLVDAVVVPLSSKVAIIGSAKTPPNLSLKALNRLLAGCSYNAFLSDRKDDALQSLSSRIGRYAKLVEERDLRLRSSDMDFSPEAN